MLAKMCEITDAVRDKDQLIDLNQFWNSLPLDPCLTNISLLLTS